MLTKNVPIEFSLVECMIRVSGPQSVSDALREMIRKNQPLLLVSHSVTHADGYWLITALFDDRSIYYGRNDS